MFDQFQPPDGSSEDRKPGISRERGPSHLKRTTAQLLVTNGANETGINQLLPASFLLNDFSPGSISVFTSARLSVKQTVFITIDQPRQIQCRGKVVQIREFCSRSSVISAKDKKLFTYRLGINFIPETDEERRNLESYYKEIQREYLGKRGSRAA